MIAAIFHKFSQWYQCMLEKDVPYYQINNPLLKQKEKNEKRQKKKNTSIMMRKITEKKKQKTKWRLVEFIDWIMS